MSAQGSARKLRLTRRTVLLALGALVLLVGIIAIAARVFETEDTAEALASREIAELTNVVRNSHGLLALNTDGALTKSARRFAEYLASSGDFGHVDGEGNGPEERATQAGYRNAVLVRENLARSNGEPDARAVVTSWLASQPHRENMLLADATEIGVACVTSGPSGFICVQEIGARSGSR